MLLDFTIALLNTALGEVVHILGIVLQLTRSNGYRGLFGSPEPTLVGLCGALRIRPAEGALFDHDSAGIQIFSGVRTRLRSGQQSRWQVIVSA
jgi:hypothetical protein